MLRWLSITTLFALTLTLAGCGSSSSEIPAKKEGGATTMTKEQSMQKAMQGMPDDIKKKMMGQMQNK
jgi:hypothetical protein